MDINTPYITDPKHLQLLNEQYTGQMKYTLMNDFLSKYGFQKDLYALRGLLAALLRIDTDAITAITILNPIEPGKELTDKECILDINLELNNSELINIEIQSRYQDFWPERSITYLCRNFDQLKSGGAYLQIKPCIQIGILGHDLFKPDDPRYTGDFYSEYRLLHTDKHTEYSSKFEIRVLSLNQLENAAPEDKNNPNGLYHWARMFNASSWEEIKMIAQDNPMISSFVGTVMELTAEEKVAQACEMRRRYSIDIATYEYEVAQAKENAALAREEEARAKEEELRAREGEARAREGEARAREGEARAKEGEARAKEGEARAKEIIAEKDAEIARLKKLLKNKD